MSEFSDWLLETQQKSSDGLTAKKLSQVYSSYDIVRKTTQGLYRSFGYREADFEGIYGSELNGFYQNGNVHQTNVPSRSRLSIMARTTFENYRKEE